MTMFMLSWCQNPSIITMHKIRLFCHMGLAIMSVLMLSSTSVVLAYSIKMYHGSFLHSIPEILTASAVSFLIVGLAWLPSDQHLGSYGIPIMRAVWQELAWSGTLTVGIGAALASLHESTPGLMTSCGRYFICRGYIIIFIVTWFGWAFIALPTFLLLASVVYQLRRSPNGGFIWEMDVDRFEYFWPGQTHLKSRRVTIITELPRVQPDLSDLKTHNDSFSFHNEKHVSAVTFHNI